jgi:hypothetical protein
MIAGDVAGERGHGPAWKLPRPRADLVCPAVANGRPIAAAMAAILDTMPRFVAGDLTD